jgi:hypothetical protein
MNVLRRNDVTCIAKAWVIKKTIHYLPFIYKVMNGIIILFPFDRVLPAIPVL